jgi:glycosyltransferase involved in cell wall biosynthesis
MKIAVYSIAKNESNFVRSFCQSAADADIILIADTGSSDDTVPIAVECGATVRDICITPWRFDRARDAALSLLPRDIDVCISLDMDEVLEPGWRAEIEKCYIDGATRMSYNYDWGNGVTFLTDKIHSRHGYHWHHPCHETLRADGRITEKIVCTEKLLITHHADPTKSRGQYLSLLAMAVEEDPNCPRNAFYYARELTFYRHHEMAITALGVYLNNPKATWSGERSAAMRLIGESYSELGRPIDAIKWCRLACAESPNDLEPWIALAGILYNQQDSLGCYTACLTALNIKRSPKTYLCDPAARGSKPYDLAALSAYDLGRYHEAVIFGKHALRLAPNDNRLKINLEWYSKTIEDSK